MYKIAVLGDRDSVIGFMAVGFSVFFADDDKTGSDTFRKLASGGEYAAIFITEELYKALSEDIDKYKDSPLPAIIPFPSKNGTQGIGMANIKKSVERAVGADILFKNS